MKYKEKPKRKGYYLFERQVKSVEMLAKFQDISESQLVRKLIDKAVGYKPEKNTIHLDSD